MLKMLRVRTLALVLTATLCLWAWPALAAAGLNGRLASVAWLQANLSRPDVLVIDSSPAALHKQQHIPGAVLSNLFTFGPASPPPAEMEQRLRSMGVSPGQQIVLVDAGGTYMAARLFWDLVHYGLPAENLFILDGGMAKWRELGGPLTQEPTPPRALGTVRITTMNQDVRVRLPEFLAATADPVKHVMLEALEPEYFFGGAAFFNRGGHVPHATLMPAGDFYNADKTFKSPTELRRMLQHLGISPEQQVLTYCGGGGAAAVPFFALRYLLDHAQVRMFQESQMGWLQDERELPLWTYGAPYLVRDSAWLKAWGSPMLKAFGLSRLGIVDVRSTEQFKLGHVPLAMNIPELAQSGQLARLEALALAVRQAGLDRSHEALVVSEGGLNEHAALAFLMLEALGQHRVSIFIDSLERWAELGQVVARPAATAGGATTMVRPPSPDAPALAAMRSGLFTRSESGPAASAARVYVASGRQSPSFSPAGRVIHLPYERLLNADGTPKAAKDIWKVLDQAGVPRYAEIVFFADSLGEAAVNYVSFKLMGFPALKVWAP